MAYESLDEMVKHGARKKKLAKRRPKARKMKRHKGGDLSAKKAREILHDGTVHGKKITDRQRRYFGAVSGGSNRK